MSFPASIMTRCSRPGNFSYLDTQLIRLGGPNFEHLPVNRPAAPVHHNQRDGYHRVMIDQSPTSYAPNSLGGGCPALSSWAEGGYVHRAERVDGHKIRTRSDSFRDFYSQARMFYRSLSDWEREHLVQAARFELGKVKHRHVRERVVAHFGVIDMELGRRVANLLGLPAPSGEPPADVDCGRVHTGDVPASPAVSQTSLPGGSIATRKVAVLVADGYDGPTAEAAVRQLVGSGVVCVPVASLAGQDPGQRGRWRR
jgi:catalase